jgi:hypothetical protein
LLYGVVAYNDWLVVPWVILCGVWLSRGRTERNT